MNANEVVRTESLTVRYGPKTAVDSVSLSIPRGSVYALLGRNGAGKSSLIRCLLGEQKPTAGRATLFGEDVWARRARLMARVGVVPEDPDAPTGMPPKRLAPFFQAIYPRWDGATLSRRLARFGVPEETEFGSLSKGQRSLTALALALASEPELLVLDDPTLGLDAVARRAFFEEIVTELADRGVTILLATHDFAGVERIADHVGILRGGRLVVQEPLEELKKRFRRVTYANERTETRTEFGNELDGLGAEAVKVRGWGIEAVVSGFTEEAFARFAQLDGVSGAEEQPLSLEEIFVALTGDARGEKR
ncbi:ABC transporter ATP-binding protein [Acidobacteria bacterium ACD]|nr:MAG: ABC transporter ATP-binding protein [Acidobacteriota bacterium]MCE7957080.1 ABC transporter ATP-binding protein [Acidobacteria bacterium ACB2]MDL1949367.1 ABC transporter ATP-binding protein [Acidobacteria bacterium ACD]